MNEPDAYTACVPRAEPPSPWPEVTDVAGTAGSGVGCGAGSGACLCGARCVAPAGDEVLADVCRAAGTVAWCPTGLVAGRPAGRAVAAGETTFFVTFLTGTACFVGA